jgi:MYXO-CTERM domain-containing protein
MCDVATGACGKCDGDLGTSTTAYACTSTELPTCRTDGNCVKCASDVDCTNPAGMKLHTLSRCNVGTGACEGPPAAVPQCDGDKNTSTTPDACSDVASPTCRADGNCGKCAADTDCVNPPGKKLHSFSVCDQATGACDKGPPAEVPLASATADSGSGSGDSGGCGCTSVPTRSSSAGVVAMGVIAAMLLRRRKRED